MPVLPAAQPRDEAQVQFWRGGRVRLDARLPLPGRQPAGARRDLGGREPGGRSAAPARPELQGSVERGREARGDLEGHLGDRAGRRFMPADRHPRPAARGRQRRALRRLDDGPLRPEDAAGNRAVAHDARLAALLASPETGCLRMPLLWAVIVGTKLSGGCWSRSWDPDAVVLDAVTGERPHRVVAVSVKGDGKHPDIAAGDDVPIDGGVALVEEDADVAVARDLVATERGRADGVAVDTDVVPRQRVARHRAARLREQEPDARRLGVVA